MSKLEDKIIDFSIYFLFLVTVILFAVLIWDELHEKHHSNTDVMVSCHNVLIGNNILVQCIPVPISH